MYTYIALCPVRVHDEHSFRFYTIEVVCAEIYVIFLMKLVVNSASALITVYELWITTMLYSDVQQTVFFSLQYSFIFNLIMIISPTSPNFHYTFLYLKVLVQWKRFEYIGWWHHVALAHLWE